MKIRTLRSVLCVQVLAWGMAFPSLAAEPRQDALNQLRSPEAIKRRIAAQELVNLRSPDTAPALMQALSDKDAYVRTLTARGLGYLRWSAAKDKLAELALKDPNAEVRQTALLSLRFLSDPATRPTFEK